MGGGKNPDWMSGQATETRDKNTKEMVAEFDEIVAEGRMDVRIAKLQGVLLLKPRRFVDARGYFVEVYTERVFHQAGITTAFVQDNQSCSFRQGTIRGLHFQLPPAAQAKLVRVIRGCVYDVAVDLRVGSPTYGEWMAERLSADGDEQIYVPSGFRARLLYARARHGGRLQGRQLLCASLRQRYCLERSDLEYPLADRTRRGDPI